MVVIQFLSLWIFGGILIFSNRQSKVFLWFGITMFLCGIGVLLVIVAESIIPQVESNDIVSILRLSVDFMKALSNYLAPYTFLVSAIYYSNVFSKNRTLLGMLPYLLAVIPFSMFFIYPFYYGFNPSFMVLSMWAVPYVLTANLLILYTYFAEGNAKTKLQKLWVAVIFCPPTLNSMFVNYILKALHNESAWRINTYVIVPYFFLFVFLLAKYGFMGIKLKIVRMRLDGTIKSVTSGTAILSHTLKNEVLKISVCMKVIEKASEDSQNQEVIGANTALVQESLTHLLGIFNKIQEHSKDIIVEAKETDIDYLMHKALKMASPILNEKSIKVNCRIPPNISIMCDDVLMTEVLLNIIKNSVEAMGVGGLLKVDVSQNINSIIISIQDNGHGIAKENISYIWDPFFSTKRTGVNLGMGLTYCYNVVQKHNASIEINSEKNKGTTIRIKFQKSVKRNKLISAKQERTHGQNQNNYCG